MGAWQWRTLRLIVVAASWLSIAQARAESSLSEKQPAQEMLTLPVRVIDPEGKPVAGATVIPWALRCSQGHGPWTAKGLGGSEPPQLSTDSDGRAKVPYPRYAKLEERVRTTEVTLSIDHPGFAYVSYEFINVPREEKGPYEATIQRGASVEIVPLDNGQPARLEGLHVMWSDDRSWKPDVLPTATDDGALRIPTMRAGAGQVLLVRLDGERATHFSSIMDLELKAGQKVRKSVELRPAVRIEGVLSDEVPRPVKKGRLQVQTLRKNPSERVDWYSWTPIAENGTFVIDAWPAGEALQVIALCEGYIAESGRAPAVVKNSTDPDPYYRPQVFMPEVYRETVTLRMTPRVRCEVVTVDEKGAPLEGVRVGSYPNVGWWNGGSQVYCSWLVRGERLLLKRDYQVVVDKSFPYPFEAVTDAYGRGDLQLPAGEQSLFAEHDDFELPVVRGRRIQEVVLVAGETTETRLVLQSKGTEYLGEWDKLAGVLFGCTGDECRRLLEDEGFRKRIAVVGEKLDSAENPTDPRVLQDAYAKMAAAFDELDDKEEAAKWRRKAAEQAAKLEVSAGPEDDGKP